MLAAIFEVVVRGRAQAQTRRRIEACVVKQAREQGFDGGHFFFGFGCEPCLKCFFSPCQHSKYSCCRMRVFMANSVGRTTSWVSNMNASVLARYCGFSSAADGALESLGIGAVAGHAVVQAGSAGNEAFGLGVVRAEDQAHEFVHQVAMEPRRAEGVLGNHPARREDGEVAVGGAGNIRRRAQHGVDRWVGVIEGDGVDAVEEGEIVLVGRVVAVPRHDVERRVIDERRTRGGRGIST